MTGAIRCTDVSKNTKQNKKPINSDPKSKLVLLLAVLPVNYWYLLLTTDTFPHIEIYLFYYALELTVLYRLVNCLNTNQRGNDLKLLQPFSNIHVPKTLLISHRFIHCRVLFVLIIPICRSVSHTVLLYAKCRWT